MTALCSICAAMGEQAREAGFGFTREEGDVRSEWQTGKRLLTHCRSEEQKPHPGCIACTHFGDLRT